MERLSNEEVQVMLEVSTGSPFQEKRTNTWASKARISILYQTRIRLLEKSSASLQAELVV